MRLGLLCSGGLGYKVLDHLLTKYKIHFIFTDSGSAEIIKLCKDKEIDAFIGNPRNGRSKDFLQNRDVDVLISVNYLFIIEKDIIEIANKLAFNIHGSLLPKYRGRTPHVWSIINGESEAGVTAHLIDEGCDTGPIIEQKRVEIHPKDTGAKLLEKYKIIYIPLIESILNKINSGIDINFVKQDETKSTYFGKRTPKDGEINWDWHKERIYNWVRAQAWPYPGAFTFYKGNRVIIDEVDFSESGFSWDMPNGLVLGSGAETLIKTPNGVVKISAFREKNIILEKNIVLGL